MTEEDVWDRKPPRLAYSDGTLYYFASLMDTYIEELKAQWDLLVVENKQLRDAMESSVEEIKEKLYLAWYQAGVKQGGILYSLELDRKRLEKVKEWTEEINNREWNYDEVSVDPVTMTDMGNLMEILGVKK